MDKTLLVGLILIVLTLILFLVPAIWPSKNYGRGVRSGFSAFLGFLKSINYSRFWLSLNKFFGNLGRSLPRRNNMAVRDTTITVDRTRPIVNNQPNDPLFRYEYGEGVDYRLGDDQNGTLVSFVATPMRQKDGSIIVWLYDPHIPDWQQGSLDFALSSVKRTARH